MCYISVRPNRHSFAILERLNAFVINLTTKDLLRETDWCGTRSGRKFNKFEKMALTPAMATKVKAPIINECPINIECSVSEVKALGVHHMFISKVEAIHVNENLVHPKTNKIELEKVPLLCYNNGFYFELGELLEKYGYSARKNT
jgi:flavin reductase (DIM6/NTAB) family NADH-FMN oxidoreductase RutF